MVAAVAPEANRPGNWLGVLGVSLIHLLAFGALYLVNVQLCWTAQEHYDHYGIVYTAPFLRLVVVSEFLAAYTPFYVILIFIEAVFVGWCFRKRKSWASAYSHLIIFAIGWAIFASTASIMGPMAWSVRAG